MPDWRISSFFGSDRLRLQPQLGFLVPRGKVPRVPVAYRLRPLLISVLELVQLLLLRTGQSVWCHPDNAEFILLLELLLVSSSQQGSSQEGFERCGSFPGLLLQNHGRHLHGTLQLPDALAMELIVLSSPCAPASASHFITD